MGLPQYYQEPDQTYEQRCTEDPNESGDKYSTSDSEHYGSLREQFISKKVQRGPGENDEA
jgi:hypothetical protein